MEEDGTGFLLLDEPWGEVESLKRGEGRGINEGGVGGVPGIITCRLLSRMIISGIFSGPSIVLFSRSQL